jgi:hypothetical protein
MCRLASVTSSLTSATCCIRTAAQHTSLSQVGLVGIPKIRHRHKHTFLFRSLIEAIHNLTPHYLINTLNYPLEQHRHTYQISRLARRGIFVVRPYVGATSSRSRRRRHRSFLCFPYTRVSSVRTSPVRSLLTSGYNTGIAASCVHLIR